MMKREMKEMTRERKMRMKIEVERKMRMKIEKLLDRMHLPKSDQPWDM